MFEVIVETQGLASLPEFYLIFPDSDDLFDYSDCPLLCYQTGYYDRTVYLLGDTKKNR